MQTTRQIRVTPTISTSAYTSGDQLGGVQTLTNAVADAADKSTRLQTLVVIDKDSEGPALELMFFSELPTVASSDNAALDVSDSEMAAKLLGVVSIASGDWVTLGGVKVANFANLNLDCYATGLDASGKRISSVYALAMIAEAKTYTATTDLVFVYNFED